MLSWGSLLRLAAKRRLNVADFASRSLYVSDVRPMTERGARMVVDRSAIKHRFAERTTTILLAR
jgi:hypothetical protein